MICWQLGEIIIRDETVIPGWVCYFRFRNHFRRNIDAGYGESVFLQKARGTSGAATEIQCVVAFGMFMKNFRQITIRQVISSLKFQLSISLSSFLVFV